ncbi:uncharacterized protein LOC125230655 [Leguminivora glycinivorella]|uniref:uncharacterized protein LOC125230655 n=1 Tax=Leguminivora glycinivorella TaxID=1035111 RepID=UPI00200D7F66|nr:uncharacterized protein LOC125230655 [Leguminivora glycinivorella]
MISGRFDFNDIGRILNEIESSASEQRIVQEHNDTSEKSSKDSGQCCMPKFNPRYLGNNVQNNKAINAIIEIRDLWSYVILDAHYVYPKVYSLLTLHISDKLKRKLQKHRQAFAVYDKQHRKWLVETDEPKYKYCFNGENFVEFMDAKREQSGNRLLLLGKFTILIQEPNLLNKTELAPSLFGSFVMPKISLTVGVPGCGKTTYIIKNHKSGSLVLTSCAEGAQDIRSRMAEKSGGSAPDYKDSYRTIDSYLINSRDIYSTVWVDEALMEHPGKLFLVCLFSRCRNLYLLGDPNQLGYINRFNEITLHYYKSSMYFKPSIDLNISYRCPVDVISIISHKYDKGAFSASKVLRSLRCKTFTTLKSVPNYESKDVKYLVFKQSEKKRMKKAKYDVSTIHEFQGKERKHVILVRMSSNLKEPLYDSVSHILVGISRHRESFVYFTPVSDTLKKLINKKRTYKEIKEAQIKLQLRDTECFYSVQ